MSKVVDISYKELVDGDIGHGTFGSVSLVNATITYENGNKVSDLFAKKKFREVIAYEKEKNINKYLRTLILKQNIDCIARMLYFDDTSLEIIIQYVPGPTLLDFANEYLKENTSFPISFFTFILKDTMEALTKLHDLQIMHGDMKSNNIILKYNTKVILIDFSLSARIGDLIPGFLTSRRIYQAPEVESDFKASSEIDVYSLGYAFISILNKNKSNFLNDDASYDVGLIKTIVERGLTTITNNDKMLRNEVSNFLISCLNKDAEKRPKIQETFLPLFDGMQKQAALPNAYIEDLKRKLSANIKSLTDGLDQSKAQCEKFRKEAAENKDELKLIMKNMDLMQTKLDLSISEKQRLEEKISTDEIKYILMEDCRKKFQMELDLEKQKNEEQREEINKLNQIIEELKIANSQMEARRDSPAKQLDPLDLCEVVYEEKSSDLKVNPVMNIEEDEEIEENQSISNP